MRRHHWEDIVALTSYMSEDQRRAISVAGIAHALHDGYTDLIYLLLPIWQPEFSLSYAAVGVLRALYTGTMAAFQVPATSCTRPSKSARS